MAAIAVAGVGMMVMCGCSSVASLMMGGEEKEDPVVPKTPAEVAAAKAQTALDALKADPDATADEIADAQAAADAAADAAPPPPPPPPPLVCGTGYLKSGTECKKLLTSSGTWIEHGGPDPHVSAANMPGYKKDYHYEFGTYYEGGQVFNVKPIPGSVGPEREKHCFKKCDDAPTCDMVTFAKGTPRGLGNENVECWGRSGSAKRVFRTDDGRFTRGDNLMDSDYHNTYHKKSKTNMQ